MAVIILGDAGCSPELIAAGRQLAFRNHQDADAMERLIRKVHSCAVHRILYSWARYPDNDE